MFIYFSSLNRAEQSRDGGGGSDDNGRCVATKPTADCYKWRLLISYDGTRYAGFAFSFNLFGVFFFKFFFFMCTLLGLLIMFNACCQYQFETKIKKGKKIIGKRLFF